MQKKLLIGAAVALFLGAGVFTATSLTQKEQISDLTLANIEAMTLNDDDPYRSPCPNGGYESRGHRSSSSKRVSERVLVEVGSNAGKVEVITYMTQEYGCDQANSNSCWICNRYRI